MVARICCACALALLAAACSDPEVLKRQHVAQGDRHFAGQRYKEAIVEYRNALKQDDKSGEARFKLAEAFVAAGNAEAAYREYVRAADLIPDPQVQLKAATMLFMAGQFDDARTRAQRVLEKDPKSVEALLLLANALAGLKDLDGAAAQVEEAIELDPKSAPALTNLALFKMAQGRREQARVAFEKAVEADPRSVKARLALGHFEWSSGALGKAEAVFKQAVEIEPAHPLANRVLAALYAGSNRAAMAEPYLRKAAETSRSASARFALADYYSRLNRFADARDVLVPLARDDRTFAEAQTRLSIVEYLSGDEAKGERALDEVLERNPNHGGALVVKARFLVAEGRVAEALERATQAVSAAPRSVGARYLQGMLQAATGRSQAAARSFGEVLRLNPRAAAAHIELSRLRLARGESGAALQFAEAAMLEAPRSLEARLALARGLVAAGELTRAGKEVAALVAAFPDSVAVHAVSGTLGLRTGDDAAARRAFERALRLDAASPAALTGLTLLDVRQRRLSSARARLEKRLAEAPKDSAVLVLAAKVYVAEKNLDRAEQVLRRAIEANAAAIDAYVILADLYAEQEKLAEAGRMFDAEVARNPTSVAALTMSAVLMHQQNDLSRARQRYRQVLDREPRAVVAANNLAWIYADERQHLDLALQLAEGAVDQLPDRADVRDTLGWVYYRKQLPRLAIGHFEDAVAREPENPTFHYHLGLAYAMSGDVALGRDAFQAALRLKPDFREAAEALARTTVSTGATGVPGLRVVPGFSRAGTDPGVVPGFSRAGTRQ
jgi:putative PEP-CTERM system TPR-repeat lipoprotein